MLLNSSMPYSFIKFLALLSALPAASCVRNGGGDVDAAAETLCDYALAEVLLDRAQLTADLARWNKSITFLPTTLAEIESMIVSLIQGCMNLDAGSASRSGASIMITADSQWVLKRIKTDEYRVLDRLMGISDRQRWVTLALRDWQKVTNNVNLLPESWNEATPDTRFYYDTKCTRKNFAKSCIRTEDPYGTYHRHFAHKASLLVPFKLVVPEERIIVMPSFALEIETIFSDLEQDLPSNPSSVKYDVKPLQVPNSRERRPFLMRLVRLRWSPANDETLLCGFRSRGQDAAIWKRQAAVRGKECWTQLQNMLREDTALLDREWDRAKQLIDYSLVFTLAELEQNVSELPANFELPASCILSRRPHSSAIVLCVNIIDYLMENRPMRWMESWFKGSKFKHYALGVEALLECAGDLTKHNCQSYLYNACQDDVQGHLDIREVWCHDLAKIQWQEQEEVMAAVGFGRPVDMGTWPEHEPLWQMH